jgi:hypothetical protein
VVVVELLENTSAMLSLFSSPPVSTESKVKSSPVDPGTVSTPSEGKEGERKLMRHSRGTVMSGVPQAIKLDLPPPFDATTRLSIHRRYRCTSTATAITVSIGELFATAGCVAITTTSVYSFVSAFLLKRVDIWPPQSSTTDRILVSWSQQSAGGYVPDSSFINTLPDGITVANGYRFRPPKKSLLADWLTASIGTGEIVMYISCPTGSIIDLHGSACLANNFTSSSYTVSSAVAGVTYYLALDGPSTNMFVPMGVTTTH